MNRHIKSAAISAVMIIFSITTAGIADAAIGMGDCGEIDGDCYSQGYIGVIGGGAGWNLATGTTVAVVDKNPVYFGILGGYRFNMFLGLELVGNYFGEPDYLDIATSNSLDARVCNTGIGVNFYLPLGRVIDDSNLDFISVFAKGGMHYWDFEAEDTVTAAVTQDDGADLYYAFGVNVDLKRHFAVRIEHTVYEIGDIESIDTDAIAVVIKF